jgi:hypothetical protein
VNPKNDETPVRGPANYTAANVPRPAVGVGPKLATLLLLGPPPTRLQRRLRDLRRVTAGARDELDPHERRVFADIGAQTFHHIFAPEFVLLEAEQATRQAA